MKIDIWFVRPSNLKVRNMDLSGACDFSQTSTKKCSSALCDVDVVFQTKDRPEVEIFCGWCRPVAGEDEIEEPEMCSNGCNREYYHCGYSYGAHECC